MEEELTEITGTVENILFKNESNGYIVFDINSDNELITVVGELGDIDENEKLRLRGSYKNHYKFGNQFCAEYVEFILPSVSSEILEYLSGSFSIISRVFSPNSLTIFLASDLFMPLIIPPERYSSISDDTDGRINYLLKK